MEKRFDGLKFGTRCLTRGGKIAIFLSADNFGEIGDENNPPFIFVNFVKEEYIKYIDGTEKTFHKIIKTNEYGKINTFNLESEDEDEDDIVDVLNIMTMEAHNKACQSFCKYKCDRCCCSKCYNGSCEDFNKFFDELTSKE